MFMNHEQDRLLHYHGTHLEGVKIKYVVMWCFVSILNWYNVSNAPSVVYI
jgi:hypothetical protein